jgi:hypothetical protein
MKLLLIQHVYSKEEQQQIRKFLFNKDTNKIYLRNDKFLFKKNKL